MKFISTRAFQSALIIVFALTTFASYSFAADFTAELADTVGEVEITRESTGETLKAVKGTKILPGDTIETMEGAAAEILYADGNVTRMDEDTELTIERLSIEKDKSKQSILRLGVGRIKNSVSKLVHKRSKFEVHTRSAVAGVTGTPPFIVGSLKVGGESRTEVDLLGHSGDPGSVSVQGTDPAGTTITLTAGTRTVAIMGLSPVRPFAIQSARFNDLQRSIQITTPPEKREEKRQEIKQEIEAQASSEGDTTEGDTTEGDTGEGDTTEGDTTEGDTTEGDTTEGDTTEGDTTEGDTGTEGESKVGVDTVVDGDQQNTGERAGFGGTEPGSGGNQLDTGGMMDHLTRQVSVGDIVEPGGSGTGEETESQINQGQGSLSGTGEDIVPSTTRVRVQVNIVNP